MIDYSVSMPHIAFAVQLTSEGPAIRVLPRLLKGEHQ